MLYCVVPYKIDRIRILGGKNYRIMRILNPDPHYADPESGSASSTVHLRNWPDPDLQFKKYRILNTGFRSAVEQEEVNKEKLWMRN